MDRLSTAFYGRWRESDQPGSVTRRLLETVAHELAALAEQLEAVYERGFVETGGSRRWLRPLVLVLALVAIAMACKRRCQRSRLSGRDT